MLRQQPVGQPTEFNIRCFIIRIHLPMEKHPIIYLPLKMWRPQPINRGWVSQADILTPLAPVATARSDTFTVRVMGENPGSVDQPFTSRSWIELTVQRIPDYVKSDLDAPHHRPHEPFEDKNFDGMWNGRDEHWLDLNQNSRDKNGNDKTSGVEAGPDLPGVGKTGASDLFVDGLKSDLKLNQDPIEETLSNPDKDISYMGINQRFGRKFRIVKFRWLNEKDV